MSLIPMVQMSKPRYREVEELAQEWQIGTGIQVDCRSPALNCTSRHPLVPCFISVFWVGQRVSVF